MKAAVLEAFGRPLNVKNVPDPVFRPGEVVVEVVVAPVLHYAGEVFNSERGYPLELPIVPGSGAVGRVLEVGPDATHLNVGDWVLCDPTVRSRDGAPSPDIVLQGTSARGEGGMRLQRYYHDGPFAERIMLPTENAIPLGPIDEKDAARWSALLTLLVPYGGLRAANLKAGETILISGATGYFGSAAVAAALAMGAGCVVAPGRNEAALAELARRFSPRLRIVALSGNEDTDREKMRRAAPGTIDVVLDLLPPSASTKPVRAAAMTVRRHGRVVLMGGVGMLGGEDLALSYRWIMRNDVTLRGKWMYTRDDALSMVGLVRGGLLPLDTYNTTEFSLDKANEAVIHASAHKEPFKLTVIRP